MRGRERQCNNELYLLALRYSLYGANNVHRRHKLMKKRNHVGCHLRQCVEKQMVRRWSKNRQRALREIEATSERGVVDNAARHTLTGTLYQSYTTVHKLELTKDEC